MTQRMEHILAPAKLNLFLHILGRRPDGYHLLQSAIMLIDWCDELQIECRADGRISREDITDPLVMKAAGDTLPEDDLCVRAARALQQATGCTLGAHISLHKRIPTQAGMGGGSSDAASCLFALNRLWRLGLSRSALQAIGLELGADVPFFLLGQNAWVEGIGEQLTPLPLPPAHWLVIKPAQGLSTAAIFQSPALRRDAKPAIIECFAADPYGFGINMLEPVACAISPAVFSVLQWLQTLGLQGRMTGSGSAVYARLPSDCLPGTAPWLQMQSHLSRLPVAAVARMCSNWDVHPFVGWSSSDV